MPQKAYNATIFIIAVKANKVNLDVMPFPDSWAQIRFFLGIIPASLLGEQCPDGRFLLVGNSQALLIIAVAMAARSFGTLF